MFLFFPKTIDDTRVGGACTGSEFRPIDESIIAIQDENKRSTTNAPPFQNSFDVHYPGGNAMFRILTAAVFAALPLLTTCVAFAQHSRELIFCDPCEPVCKKSSLWDQVSLYGWVQAGISVNNHGGSNQYTDTEPNGPCWRNLDAFSGNSYLFMSKLPSNFTVYQTWLGMKKDLDTKHGFDWGFQVDTLFGTDANATQAFGDQRFDYDWGTGDYHFSFVQLFAEAGYKNLKFRVGKFGPAMVHEALPAPMTFFHSFSYSCYNTVLTASGATAEYKLNDRLTVTAGWTTGMHNSFSNRFSDNGLVGKILFAPADNVKLAYNVYYGESNGYNKVADAHLFGRDYDTADHVIHTLICTINLGKQWLYMIEGGWGNNDYELAGIDTRTRCYGINQHLIYTVNERWAVGVRAEWSHAEGTMFDMPHLTGGGGTDLYSLTFGMNWTPNAWFILRPEVRYDWTDYVNGFKPFDNKTQANQMTAGGSVVVKF